MERRIFTENGRSRLRRKSRSLCATIALVGATTLLVSTQPLHCCCHAETTASSGWPVSRTRHSSDLHRQGGAKHHSSKRKDDHDDQQQHLSTRFSQSTIDLSFFLRGASIDRVRRVEPTRRKLVQSTDVESDKDDEEQVVDDKIDSQDTVTLGISSAGTGGKGGKSTKGSKSGSSTTSSSTKSNKSSKNSKSSGKGSADGDYVYDDDQYGGNGDSTDDNMGGGDDDDDNNGGGDDNNGGDDDDDDNGGGGGDDNGGGGDDDDDDDSAPVSSPIMSPDGSGNEPTQEPTTDNGSGGTPTDTSTSEPTTEPPDSREPPTSPPDVSTPTLPPDASTPTSAPTQPRCPIGEDGLFGSQIGISQEFAFAYQLQVIPSVTVSEINLSVLQNIEPAMGERIVARLFDQCAPTSSPGTTESRSIPTDPNTFNHKRRWLSRMLQTNPLDGFSIRPRDNVVLDGSSQVECVNVEQVYPCYVIRGRVTTYTEQPITDETKARVDSAIEASITADGLQAADSRVIAATWRDENTDPLPDGGNNGGGGSDIPTPAPGGGDNNGGGGGTTPTTVPIEREVSNNPELQPWQISLIAVGGVLICCMAYLCLRRRSHAPIYDDDDKEEDEEGSHEENSNQSSKKEKVPLVTPEYQPPEPQQMQSQQPSNDPYRDPYSLPSTRPQQPEEPPERRRSRASSEGTPIEKASESTDDEDEDEDYEDGDEFDDEQGIDPPPSMEQHSVPSVGTRQTAQDNQMLNPYRTAQENQTDAQPQWDEAMFVQSTMPPPESTSDEFSSEYSEEEVDEEYEIEYVEDEEGLEGVDEEYDDDEDEDDNDDGEYDDDDEDGSYSDEYDDEDGQEVVEDEPGKTPILPWLAQDEQ